MNIVNYISKILKRSPYFRNVLILISIFKNNEKCAVNFWFGTASDTVSDQYS